MKKPTHGGKRKGAGRPKLPRSKIKESTVVMRVPKRLKKAILKFIKDNPKPS